MRKPILHAWQPTSSLTPLLQSLQDGAAVVLPTESTYEVVVSALHPEALTPILYSVGKNLTPAIVLTELARLRDWFPYWHSVATRLFWKLNGGPLLLRGDGGNSYGIMTRLPILAQRLLLIEGKLAVRWPAHPAWTLLREMDVPLISLALPSALTAQQAQEQVGESIAHLIDAGPTEFGKPPSVVRIEGRNCHLECEGAWSSERIRDLSLCRILFLCTGNTCRSPMAEALCKKLLAEQLGCTAAELEEHGYMVQSAGLAAMSGHEASPHAATVVAESGGDLSAHRSRMVTMELLSASDLIFVMTATHGQMLKNVPIPGLPTPRLLAPGGADLIDPFGGELVDYRTCADQILAYLRHRLPELLEA